MYHWLLLVKNKLRIGVIEGDIASTIDADKITKQNAPVIQINTAGGCHLEANLVLKALKTFSLGRRKLAHLGLESEPGPAAAFFWLEFL